MKLTKGSIYKYLRITLIYTNDEKLQIDKREYIEEILLEFPEEISGSLRTLWNSELFKINKNENLLDEPKQNIFHG